MKLEASSRDVLILSVSAAVVNFSGIGIGKKSSNVVDAADTSSSQCSYVVNLFINVKCLVCKLIIVIDVFMSKKYIKKS